MVRDVRRCSANGEYPPVLFFHLASVEDGDRFFAKYWPDARAVADPDGAFYSAFGLGRARIRDFVGLSALRGYLRAFARGNSAGKPRGDVRIMPGVFLVRSRRVVWEHPFRSVSDHPDFATIPIGQG